MSGAALPVCPTCGPQSAGAAFCANCGSPLTRGGKSREGTVLAERYRLVKLLGQGGMGEVYAAEHVHISKKFAIKLLRPEVLASPEAVVRFRQEAWAASSIGQENIIGVEDFAILPDGTVYLAMEYLDGESLAERMKRAPVPLAEGLDLLSQVCRGLGAAHEKGIVHRDLKPENLFVVRAKPEVVKILDFGIAKVLGGGDSQVQTRTGQIIGTPQYMSPEQASGRPAGPATDVYSLGVILYEIAAGRVPFSGDSAIQVLMKHMSVTPQRPSEIAPERNLPGELDQLILAMLAKEPGERPSIAQVAEQLERARRQAALPSGARAVIPSGAARAAAPVSAAAGAVAADEEPARSRRGVWIVALALLAVGLGAGGVALWRGRSGPAPVAPGGEKGAGDERTASKGAAEEGGATRVVESTAGDKRTADKGGADPRLADQHGGEQGADRGAAKSAIGASSDDQAGSARAAEAHKGARSTHGDPAHGSSHHGEAKAAHAERDTAPAREAPAREAPAREAPVREAPAREPPPPADPLVARIDAQARQLVPGSHRVQVLRGEGPRTDWWVHLDAGRCYTFVGTVEAGGLYLYLWGPMGHRLGDYRARTQTGSIYHCAAFAGQYRLQGKLAGGFGPYRLGVYTK